MTGRRRLPAWLRRSLPRGAGAGAVIDTLDELGLATVCHSARCPNRAECFAAGTATFLILGDICTRHCTFCAVAGGEPQPLRDDEPVAVAEAAARWDLKHVVITSVTRDDLPDGGASHFAATIQAVRDRLPSAQIEVLVPDFQGDESAISAVIAAGCNVFNHNIETAERLYPIVRPEADHRRSLDVLAHARTAAGERALWIKSGLMVGLGEHDDDVLQVMRNLRRVGCDLLTIGQYLQPTDDHLSVERFVPLEQFDRWRGAALAMGFSAVAAGPYVRSSYHAATMIRASDDTAED